MIVETVVTCTPAGADVQKLRELLCGAQKSREFAVNPLTATDFNEVLDRVVQQAFDEGRAFERNKEGQ